MRAARAVLGCAVMALRPRYLLQLGLLLVTAAVACSAPPLVEQEAVATGIQTQVCLDKDLMELHNALINPPSDETGGWPGLLRRLGLKSPGLVVKADLKKVPLE